MKGMVSQNLILLSIGKRISNIEIMFLKHVPKTFQKISNFCEIISMFCFSTFAFITSHFYANFKPLMSIENLFLFRNLKLGYFSQHHVDQLNMNLNSVQLLQTKFPGLVRLPLWKIIYDSFLFWNMWKQNVTNLWKQNVINLLTVKI